MECSLWALPVSAMIVLFWTAGLSEWSLDITQSSEILLYMHTNPDVFTYYVCAYGSKHKYSLVKSGPLLLEGMVLLQGINEYTPLKSSHIDNMLTLKSLGHATVTNSKLLLFNSWGDYQPRSRIKLGDCIEKYQLHPSLN